MGDVSKGQIREGLGTALFNVHYSCLVLRPHKGEVMDCVVTSVSKVNLRKQPAHFCSIAWHASNAQCPTVQEGMPEDVSPYQAHPLRILHSPTLFCRCRTAVGLHTGPACNIPGWRVSSLAITAVQVGFFADAGPLQLFVSNHLIPEDFSFDSANEPAFVSSDEAVRVQAGAEVRLRIVGTRVDADEIVRR